MTDAPTIEPSIVRRALPTLRDQLGRLTPAIAILVALAVWVAAVPTHTLNATGSNGGASGATIPGANAFRTTDNTLPGGAPAPNGVVGATASGGKASAGGGQARSTNPACAGKPSLAYAVTTPSDPCATPGLDCARNKVSLGRTCRPPKPSGIKLRATGQGVTADKVTVVFYNVKQNAQVQAILNQAGTANDADKENALTAIGAWTNQNFELYGRKLDVHYVVGTSAANDPAGQQADAIEVATDYKPFLVITTYAGDAFYDELHRRGIMSWTWFQYSSQYFQAHQPDMFGFFPDRDTTLDQVAEYACKRLNGHPAAHAGDPTIQVQQRTFAAIYQDAYDNGPYFKNRVKQLCGADVLILSYPADISQAVQISTNLISQLKSAHISTVTCLCDVIAPIFLTEQATNQGYFPEWLQTGFAVTDANAAGRLYDQSQWKNSFGPSTLAFPALLRDTGGYRVCIAGGGAQHSCQLAQATPYAPVAFLATALEVLGPDNISNTNVSAFFLSAPAQGGTKPNELGLSFGTNGPGPYTFLDDDMEIWWDPTRTGNDGKTGAAFLVQSGKRYTFGKWPTTAPDVFRDDGSPQPPRDPDYS